METNSPGDTDHSLPSEDAASNGSTDRHEAPEQRDATLEAPAATVEAAPELAEESASPEATEDVQGAEETVEESPAATGPTESPAATDASAPPAEAAPELDPLHALAAQSQRARLSAPDEERAMTLLKETLLEGRAGVTRAVGVLPNLPWVIGVSAVTAVWKDLKTAFRAQLLSGLAKNETDAARRVRLSLARGLFKVDVPIALKLAVAVAKEMRDKETGELTPKNAQIFANVLIGRAKPWIAQIPLNDLKPTEADLLVHCALVSAFSVPHAPVTQLGVIKWAAEARRMTKLHEAAQEGVIRGLGRWSAKWQNALRKEVEDLPEPIVNALKAPAPQPGGPEESGAPERRERPEAGPRKAAEPKPADKAPADKAPVEAPKAAVDFEEEDEDEEEEEEDDERDETAEKPRPAEAGGREHGRPRPVYESKTIPRKPEQQPQPQQQPREQQQPRGQTPNKQGMGPFDLRETLRQIESHVAGLRSELVSTQNKLRQREQDAQKAKRSPDRAPAVPIIPGEPTPDELARLNQQLEARNAELQQRIHELTQDSEDRAASMGIHGPEPVEQPDAQLRTLLALKLQEDYEDFMDLEKEKPDLVVQQHYRTVLRHVIEVLRQEGVEFEKHRAD